jgi:hypothetical protein
MESLQMCLRIECDGRRLRPIPAGAELFPSEVMNENLSDAAVNRRALS